MKYITKKQISKDNLIIVLFLFAEIICYYIFIGFDLTGIDSTDVKFASILICFVTVFFYARLNDNRIIIVPFVFTILADVHLLVLNDYYEIGTALFCIVQLCYAARIMFDCNSKDDRIGEFIYSLTPRKSFAYSMVAVIIRVAVYAVTLIILYINNLISILTALALLSYTQLFLNTILSLLVSKKIKNGMFFFTGLLLFLLCDTCVGLKNIALYRDFPTDISKICSILIWVFYLPSQVLIALSLILPVSKTNKT